MIAVWVVASLCTVLVVLPFALGGRSRVNPELEGRTMTDMRATERLLEAIDEEIGVIMRAVDSMGPEARDVRLACGRASAAQVELRRRGDTLVRAADLRRVIVPDPLGRNWTQQHHDAYDRLQNALGGRMR